MANYYATTRTNYFRVTDEEKYKELFSRLVGEDEIIDFTETREDGTIVHGFGTYGWIDYVEDVEEDTYDIDLFYTELQKILPDNEAFILFEVGNEKLRYVNGYACVITSKDITHLNLADLAIEHAQKILGKDFKTQIDY